jgi:hypothetical protein
MAARRKRATVQRGASIKASRFKAAGIRAHNIRLGSAIAARNSPYNLEHTKKRSMGLAEARMTRLRRKVRAANPRLHARRNAGRGVLQHAINRGDGGRYLRGDPSRIARRPKRMYKRDSRGRFSKTGRRR